MLVKANCVVEHSVASVVKVNLACWYLVIRALTPVVSLYDTAIKVPTDPRIEIGSTICSEVMIEALRSALWEDR